MHVRWGWVGGCAGKSLPHCLNLLTYFSIQLSVEMSSSVRVLSVCTRSWHEVDNAICSAEEAAAKGYTGAGTELPAARVTV